MTIVELIKNCKISLAGEGNINVTVSTSQMHLVLELKAKKSEIAAYLEAEKEAESKRIENIKNNLPGLEELRTAYHTNNENYEKQQESIERGGRVYRYDRINTETLENKYPAAKAYLTAETWSDAENADKRVIGLKAMTKLENGENHETVLAEMKKAWSENCKESMWA